MILEILVVLFFGIGDLVTTKIALNLGGHEANPIMKYFLNKFGFGSFVVLKALAILYIFYFSPNYKLFLIGVGIVVVGLNLRVIRKRYRIKRERELAGLPKI